MEFELPSLAQTKRGLNYVQNKYSNRSENVVSTPEQAAEALFDLLGLDMSSSHMQETPGRFVKMLRQMTTPDNEWKFTTFPAESDEMIVLGPIPYYTLCAHHVVPFYGQAFIGYVPNMLIAGLSKFARFVKSTAKGLWVQETLTASIANGLNSRLESPKGVAVVLEGEHLCMSARGAETPGVITTTSAMRGVFADHSRTAKAEFMQIIDGRRKRG